MLEALQLQFVTPMLLNCNHVRLPGEDYIIMLPERCNVARNNGAQIQFRWEIHVKVFQWQVEPARRHGRWGESASRRYLLVNFHGSIDLLSQPVRTQRTPAQLKSVHERAHHPKGELLISRGGVWTWPLA
jgi:hypothetical protein